MILRIFLDRKKNSERKIAEFQSDARHLTLSLPWTSFHPWIASGVAQRVGIFATIHPSFGHLKFVQQQVVCSPVAIPQQPRPQDLPSLATSSSPSSHS